jgi:hypothetical protein
VLVDLKLIVALRLNTNLLLKTVVCLHQLLDLRLKLLLLVLEPILYLLDIVGVQGVELVFLFQNFAEILLKAFSGFLEALSLGQEGVVLLDKLPILQLNLIDFLLINLLHLFVLFLLDPLLLLLKYDLILVLSLLQLESQLDNLLLFDL